MADLLQAGLEAGGLEELEQGALNPFLTGFSAPCHTKPGFGLQTQQFKVIFRGVTENGENNETSETLETCYDWSGVMTVVLGATSEYQSLEELE